MNRGVQALACLAVLLAVFSAAGCAKLKARDQLNKGVQSFKNSRYEEAIEHFKNAASLDPELVNARLYLATAYAKLYVPGADTEENKRMAYSAIEEYKRALTQDPGNMNAIKSIARLYLQTNNLEQAKQYYQQAATVAPNDPDNFQAIAAIDWNTAYIFRQEQRHKLGLKPTDQLKDKHACAVVKAANDGPVNEGIKMLQKALQIRSDYEDAMNYMSLLYLERADYQCDNSGARAADTKSAIEWKGKALAIGNAKLKKQQEAAAASTDQKKQ
jgi:tetratricopeptide (TPR) repeat protein